MLKVNYKLKGLVPEIVGGFKIGDFCMCSYPGIFKIEAMKPVFLTQEMYDTSPAYFDSSYSVPDLTTGKWNKQPIKPGELMRVDFVLKQYCNGAGTKTSAKTKKTFEVPFNQCYAVNIDNLTRNLKYDRDRYKGKMDAADKKIAALDQVKKEIDAENKDKAAEPGDTVDY